MSREIRVDPPKSILRFLAWFCPRGLYEGIEGDLIEQFDEEVKLLGVAAARRRFLANTLKFFRPGIIFRNKFTTDSSNISMFKSYFVITFRNLLRNKGYSFINIFGLSLGIAVCLLTFNYISFESSYDSTHPDVDRLYRVNQTNIWDPAGGVFPSTGPAVSFALKNDYAEIEDIVRVNTPGERIVRYTETSGNVLAFNETNVLAADSNFFSFFDFKLKEGDPRTALAGKNKVVISEEVAKRLFGGEPALGKILQIGDDRSAVEITGVTARQPENIHFHFDYMMSIYTTTAVKRFEWSWIWTQVVTYVKLVPGTNVASLNEKMKSFADRNAPATFKLLRMDYKEFMREKGHWEVYLQPVRNIYLDPANIGNRLGPIGDLRYVYILGIVAICILMIAVINFINLSTARGATRAKEVGVKKTLGLMRSSLIAQFQVENIIITSIAVVFGVIIMELLQRVIQPVVGINIPLVYDGDFSILMISMPLIIGFLAGIYPAFYLTAFSPSQVLKGKLSVGFRASGLRNALVVLQFTISIAFMAATVIVFQQIDFFRSKNVGFEKENLLVIGHAEKLDNQLQSYRDEISAFEGVVDASLSMDIRAGYEDIYSSEGSDQKVSISQYKIDEHFFKTTKLSLAAGREFDMNRPSDKNATIINETGARLLGWKNEEALGKHIVYNGDEIGPMEVIGVAKDFHFQSLRQNIMPFMFCNINSTMWGNDRVVLVRYKTNDLPGLLDRLEKKWNSLAGDTPFVSSFYDDEVKMQYQQEQRLGSLFSVFTGLSIAIAVIGLIGLVAYSAEVRKKEIGIRKVFGASVSRIMIMMNSQYIRLIIVSVVLATPFTWWLLQQWLDTFAYKIEISPLVFVVAGVAELLLALGSVAFLSLRAASQNPSKALKEE